MGKQVSRVEGRILFVQEDRFRIRLTTGQTLLLTLGKDANIGLADLQALHAEAAAIFVGFSGQPNTASGVAVEVKRAGASNGGGNS